MKAIPHQKELQHLYWRTGFGPKPEQIAQAPRQLQKEVKQVFASAEAFTPLQVQVTPYGADAKKELLANERKLLMQQARQELIKINTSWINRMAVSEAQLREKMTFFWHGHFACRTQRPDFALNQNNILRQHALGKFSDLLLAVSKDPAMLQFLNNQQNRKRHPNENFAREVLELFTMGRGHYTENDIKNAARAFTGWGYDAAGNFVFRQKAHDTGSKTFLGKTGNFTGEDILQIILDNPQTAAYITTKICRFFINEQPSPTITQELSRKFYQSGYDIEDLMYTLFRSDWAYAPENIGNRIKSPVELIVGLQRTFAIDFQDPQALIVLQRALGQVLLYPPNVSGWPGGINWIDSSSLILRMQLPQALFAAGKINISLKDDDIDMVPQLSLAERTFNRRINARVNMQAWQALLRDTPDKQLIQQTAAFLLQPGLHVHLAEKLQQETTDAARPNKINLLALRLCSLPEYQLC